ncbi:response regulator transcription factor [Peptococcus simiae]|uniref:Stage 0 sporulation protein A homolog n=1 Tax=Peptococcus simiae TaxID=1643805 RepID=A0ABW9H183_9FIRM
MQEKLLVVEDEENIRQNITDYFIDQGYKVVEARDGEEALTLFDAEKPDLVILDLMLPKLDGIDVCKTIRKEHTTPIIMVTARSEEIDKLLGLELGADDYITKPFSLRELNARVKAVFRRSRPVADHLEDVRVFGPLKINLDRREVRYNDETVDLTPSEYAILITLSENVGRPYSRLQLLTATLGESYAGYERAIDTHVSNLRKKIEPNPQKPIFIQTVYGLGYKFGDQYEPIQED